MDPAEADGHEAAGQRFADGDRGGGFTLSPQLRLD